MKIKKQKKKTKKDKDKISDGHYKDILNLLSLKE